MTTAELTKQLQESVPTGTSPVCVDNYAIAYVTSAPAYYDGALEEIDGDTARVVRLGQKVRIYTKSIEYLLMERPDTPVEIVGTDHHGEHARQFESWRAAGRELRKGPT